MSPKTHLQREFMTPRNTAAGGETERVGGQASGSPCDAVCCRLADVEPPGTVRLNTASTALGLWKHQHGGRFYQQTGTNSERQPRETTVARRVRSFHVFM